MSIADTNPQTASPQAASPQTASQQAALRQLLAVQATDTEISQLTQNLNNLPQRATCQEIGAKLEQANQLQAKIQAHLDKLDAEQKQTEKEIEGFDARLSETSNRLYSKELSGGLKAIEALQEQSTALKTQKHLLEEVVLDIIERREEANQKKELVDAKHSEISQQLSEATQQLEAAEAEINGALEELGETRLAQIADIPQALLADYEDRRDRLGGVGVAALVSRHCIGCDLNIEHPTVEVERMRSLPPDAVVDCTQCGRIMVIAD